MMQRNRRELLECWILPIVSVDVFSFVFAFRIYVNTAVLQNNSLVYHSTYCYCNYCYMCNISETSLDNCYAQGEFGVCFWTAGQRLDPSPGSESEFVWRVVTPYNETVSAMDYTNWYPDQPSNYRGNEGCMMMWSGREYKWNDQHCSRSPMCSVCEIDLQTSTHVDERLLKLL